MSSSNDDGEQNFIVAFLFALIALVLFLVIGIAIRQVHGKAGAGPAPAAAEAMAVPVVKGGPADKIDPQKPFVRTGSGSNAPALRVDDSQLFARFPGDIEPERPVHIVAKDHIPERPEIGRRALVSKVQNLCAISALDGLLQ